MSRLLFNARLLARVRGWKSAARFLWHAQLMSARAMKNTVRRMRMNILVGRAADTKVQMISAGGGK